MTKPTAQEERKLITEVEAYLAFWAIARPLAAPPRVEVNARRVVRRINAYSMKEIP